MIQIDMPMPDNCLECRFNTSEFGYCNAMPVEFVGQVSDGKPEWCPLKAQEPPTSEFISSAIECLLHPQDADDSDMAKAIDTAVRAMRLLKAQEAVKPTWKNGYPLCGECGFKLHWIIEQNNYCPNCGRAVKWNDT